MDVYRQEQLQLSTDVEKIEQLINRERQHRRKLKRGVDDLVREGEQLVQRKAEVMLISNVFVLSGVVQTEVCPISARQTFLTST